MRESEEEEEEEKKTFVFFCSFFLLSFLFLFSAMGLVRALGNFVNPGKKQPIQDADDKREIYICIPLFLSLS